VLTTQNGLQSFFPFDMKEKSWIEKEFGIVISIFLSKLYVG